MESRGHGPILATEETEKWGEEVASVPVCLSIYSHPQAATQQRASGTMKSPGSAGSGQAAGQKVGVTEGADCRGRDRWHQAARSQESS